MNNDNQNPWGNQSEQNDPWENNNQNPWGGHRRCGYAERSHEQNDPWGNDNQNLWGDLSEQQKNPWVTSQSMIDNPYMENPYETNFFDTPYSETFANPDPQNEQDSAWEI